MRNSLKIALLALIFSLSSLQAQNTVFQPVNSELLKVLFQSSNRYVSTLAGDWEKSHSDNYWEQVQLPSCDNRNSTVYYRKDLKISADLLDKYEWQLFFLGIEDELELYLNDNFVGRYFGGMTPFYVRLPRKMLVPSNNTVKLVIHAASYAARQIKEQNFFAKSIYTGVLRDIILLGTSHIWISDLKYKTSFNQDLSSCNLNSTVNISSGEIEKLRSTAINPDSLGDIGFQKTTIQIDASLKRKASGELVANTNPVQLDIERERTIPIEFNFQVQNPVLWSPSNPFLYELSVRIRKNGQLIDEYITDIGFKEFSASFINGTAQLFLNNQPFEVKGVDYIEDNAQYNQSLGTFQMEQDILTLKTLGANLIKFVNTVPHPYLLSLCDKYGILTLVELPAYDIPNSIISSDEIIVRMKNIADRIIASFDNHVCIAGWGISSGLQEDSQKSKDFINTLSKIFKSTSPKPVYKTVSLNSKVLITDDIDFICVRRVEDGAGIELIREKLRHIIALTGKKPLIFNFGKAAQLDNNNGYSDPLSIEAQAFFIQNMDSLSREFNLCGSIVWSFNDFSLNNPLMIFNNPDLFICTSGLVDRYRQQRKSFSTLQSIFNKEKNPLLNAGSFTESSPLSFLLLGIALCLVILFLLNRFRRFREYLFRSLLRPYNFYSDIRDQRIMSIFQSLILAGVISLTLGSFCSSLLFFLRSSFNAQYVLTLILPLKLLREIIFRMVWMPEMLTLFLSLCFFAGIFLIALILRCAAFFVRTHIYFTDTLMITIWSGTPQLLLLPFSLALIRIIIYTPTLLWLAVALFMVTGIWTFLRVIRASYVVFDIPAVRAYLTGAIFVIFIGFLVLAFYQYEFSIFAYSQYFINVLLN